MACGLEFTGGALVCPRDGTELTPAGQDPLVGTILADRYEILSVIGRGGMGVVYKAMHQLMEKVVAIKMMHAHLVSDQLALKRFQQEAKAASCLNHPHLIGVHDFGVTPAGQPYLVMDFLEGKSLTEIIDTDGTLAVKRALRIFAQACDGLAHAHNKGVIHRDLKPGNILLVDTEDKSDFVKIVDFGIAKLLPHSGKESQALTQLGETFGSPPYMSPEQCMGLALDPRSDIYSLGCVMYEALTGQPPLLGSTMLETMNKHVSEMPRSFSEVCSDLYIPERLEKIVFKTLDKNPELRPQSMLVLKDALETVGRDLESGTASLLATGRRPAAQTVRLVSSGADSRQPARIPALIAIGLGMILIILAFLAGRGTLHLLLASHPQTAAGVAGGTGGSAAAEKLWQRYDQSADTALREGELEKAHRSCEQALKSAQQFRPDDPRLAHTLNILANVYRAQGNYGQAEPLFRQALQIRAAALGADDPDVAASEDSLGRLYQAEGRYRQAEPLFKQALATKEKSLGPDSPDLVGSLKSLALLYQQEGRYVEAEAIYERILRILEKALGPQNPELASTLKVCAELLRKSDRESEANRLEARLKTLNGDQAAQEK